MNIQHTIYLLLIYESKPGCTYINITTAFNYHSQSPIIFLINTILNGLQFPPVNLYTRTIQYLPFKHNIPQYRPHLLATRDCNHAAGDFPSLAKGNYQCTEYYKWVPFNTSLQFLHFVLYILHWNLAWCVHPLPIKVWILGQLLMW